MRRIALAALLVTSAASAKTDIGFHDGPEPNDPVAVRAKLEGISARLFVDYRIQTSDPKETLVTSLDLQIPFGAVVTAATITHGGVAHRMTLDASEVVQKTFEDAFSGEPSSRPTMWIAKITHANTHLDGYAINVSIGAPIRTVIGLSLEVVVPTCFFRDKRYVRAPIGWEKATRSREPSADVMESCAHANATEPDAWIAFPAPQAARRPSGDRVQATTARLAIDHDLHLARTELALAENLADIPRDLATVILVDESRSMTDHQRRSQREIVLGYLRAAPNSRVQVLAFSRRTRPLLPAWTLASRASARLERELASMERRNGSNFDVGLADAGRLLAETTGTRRVLLVTDEAMASRLSNQPAQLPSLVPAGTIINVAVVTDFGDIDDEGNAILSRHDRAKLAPLSAATTGIATSLGEVDSSRRIAVDASMLVRPTSLDHIRTTGLGWSAVDDTARDALAGDTCNGSLSAGASCVWWTRGSRFSGPIQIEGLLWNQRVVRLVRPLVDPGRTIAREIVATGAIIPAEEDPNAIDTGGNERLGRRIDILAHAVTSTTSLVARWGGDVPFSDGFVIGGFGGFGRSGTIGSSSGIGTISRAAIPAVDLAAQLRPLVGHCKLGVRRAVVMLEITFLEIVHVDVAVSPAPGDTGEAERRCIEEATWDFMPVLPSLEAFRTERVVL